AGVAWGAGRASRLCGARAASASRSRGGVPVAVGRAVDAQGAGAGVAAVAPGADGPGGAWAGGGPRGDGRGWGRAGADVTGGSGELDVESPTGGSSRFHWPESVWRVSAGRDSVRRVSVFPGAGWLLSAWRRSVCSADGVVPSAGRGAGRPGAVRPAAVGSGAACPTAVCPTAV